MRISVIGIGYVGLVTGVGLAELGHQVTCINRNQEISRNLRQARVHFYEPGLKEMLARNLKKKRIFFTTSIKNGIKKSKAVFITVQTPQGRDGKVDLSYVYAVAHEIGRQMNGYKVIVDKSTVPVGTAKKVATIIRGHYHGGFDMVSCPEFLREGSAINDFLKSDRLVVGCESQKAMTIMKNIFKPLKVKKLYTSLANAELIKYASNAFLATKISFINEMANICERVGADVDVVAQGMGLDKRINPYFLKAGIGYGGSCFPKDVKALNQTAGTHGYDFKLLKAVIRVNKLQREMLVKKVIKAFYALKGRQFTVFGLAFKNNTDDIRESAAIEIIRKLQTLGARISAYDPIAEDNARAVLKGVVFHRDPYVACLKSDAVIIATEWPEFKTLDWAKIKKILKRPYLFDGKNLLNGNMARKLGFNYQSIGRK